MPIFVLRMFFLFARTHRNGGRHYSRQKFWVVFFRAKKLSGLGHFMRMVLYNSLVVIHFTCQQRKDCLFSLIFLHIVLLQGYLYFHDIAEEILGFSFQLLLDWNMFLLSKLTWINRFKHRKNLYAAVVLDAWLCTPYMKWCYIKNVFNEMRKKGYMAFT